MPTHRQIREACELLGWSRYDPQRATALHLDVVDRLLAPEGSVEATLEHEVVVGDALHRAGVEFIPENGGGAGVRLRKGEA